MIAHAERSLATVRTVRADGWHVLHLPRTRLIAIRAAGERADGANVDAHTAFFAFQVIAAVRDDHAVRAAHAHAERFYVHALVANAHAAEAQNASRSVVINQLGPLLFGAVNLLLDEPAEICAIAVSHVLQFAFAALVAHRAVQRMVGQEKLEHGLARLAHLVRIGSNDHAVGGYQRARGLEFGRFFDFHQAHAACRLERQAGIVTERWHFRSDAPRRLDDQRTLRNGSRSEEHTSELQSRLHLVCRLLLEKKKSLIRRVA